MAKEGAKGTYGDNVDVALEQREDAVDQPGVPAQHVQVHADQRLTPRALHLQRVGTQGPGRKGQRGKDKAGSTCVW